MLRFNLLSDLSEQGLALSPSALVEPSVACGEEAGSAGEAAGAGFEFSSVGPFVLAFFALCVESDWYAHFGGWSEY